MGGSVVHKVRRGGGGAGVSDVGGQGCGNWERVPPVQSGCLGYRVGAGRRQRNGSDLRPREGRIEKAELSR